jgi:hypothetical protein
MGRQKRQAESRQEPKPPTFLDRLAGKVPATKESLTQLTMTVALMAALIAALATELGVVKTSVEILQIFGLGPKQTQSTPTVPASQSQQQNSN